MVSRRLMLEVLESRQVLSTTIPLNELTWTELGPAPILQGQTPGNQSAIGRITALAAHPTDLNTLYAAGAGGGVWKSTDGGTAWVPLTDDQSSLFMGAMALAPSNPEIVYAGTGDASNSDSSYFGRGILKSVDGGGTWSLLPGNAGSNEFDGRTIAQIVVHPSDPDTVYVAVSGNGINGLTGNTGVWKTADGGVTWTNTTALSGLSTVDAYSDLAINPSDPDTLYTAIGTASGSGANGVYKTTDGGASWARAGDFPVGTEDASIGRIRLAIAPILPDTLYASIVDDMDSPAEPEDGSLYLMLKSMDGGETWTELTGVPNYLGNQGGYNSILMVSPLNPDEVIAGGAAGTNSIIHSFDEGATWNDVSVGLDGIGPHGNHHAFHFNAAGLLIDGNDGGVWRLDDPTPGSVHWTNLTGDLGVAQLVGIALHPTDIDKAYGATSFGGIVQFDDNRSWEQLAAGSAGYVRIDRGNPEVLYRSFHYGPGFIERSEDGGTTWQVKTEGIDTDEPANVVAPFVTDTGNPARLLTGTDRVYESTDRADSWSAISAPLTSGWNSAAAIDAIAAAPSDVDTIYASAEGRIFSTIDRGGSWTERSLPTGGRVSDLIVDPLNSQRVFAVRGEFGSGHVWQTVDGGMNWEDISGNLPDLPVWSIELDRQPANDRLFVGTDQGVYATNGASGLWTRFGGGLPNAKVADLELNTSLNILAAGTLGRGMWQIQAAPTADSFEPNPTRESARELGVIPGIHLRNVSMHQVGASIDEDWYRVELLRDDDLDFTVSFIRALADVNLEVTDVDGNLIGSASTGSSDQESISLAGLGAGTYFIHVSANGPTHYDLSVDPGAGSATRVIYVNDEATGNDVYSNAVGDDSNDGLSPLQPKRSLQSVLDDLDLGGSDLVLIDSGTYSTGGTILVADEGATIGGSGIGSHLEATAPIALVNADSNVIFLLRFSGSGILLQGDGVSDSANNVLRRNSFADTSPAIQVKQGVANRLVENVIEGTGEYGVHASEGAAVTLLGNTILGREFGVYATGASELSVGVGNLFTNNRDGVYVVDGSVEITGNTFASNDRGVYLSPGVVTATVHGNDVDSNTNGIRSDTGNARVFGNDIHDSTSVGLAGIGVFGGDNWDSGQANEVHDNAIGIQPESGATIRFNQIHENTVGIRIEGQPSGNSIDIHHNVIYRNATRGIHVSQADGVNIFNNTIYATGSNADAVRIDGATQRVTHKNNILWADEGYCLWVDTDSQLGFASDFNNLYASGAGKLGHWQTDFRDLLDWQTEVNQDLHSIGTTSLDPLLDAPNFVNLAGDDYRLADAISTSIDAADPTSPFALEPAPNGGRADLGAYGNTTQASHSRPAYLEVDYPNFYTDWEEQESGTILWHGFNVAGVVDIELYSDNGAFLAHIDTVDVSLGSLNWTPESSGVSGDSQNRYRIRIALQGEDGIADESREAFSVPPRIHDFSGDENNDFFVNDASTANDEYTAAVGSNRNTGKTPDDPKPTLLAMLQAYDLGPSTTVWMDTGDYLHVRSAVISGASGIGDDDGLTVTGPSDPARVARLDRGSPIPGAVSLEVNNGDQVTLRNLTFSGGNRGLWVHQDSADLLGSNLTFSDNAAEGLLVESDSANATLDHLLAFANGSHGIAIKAPIGSLAHNVAHDNLGAGILLQTSTSTRLEGNEAYNNGVGISVASSASDAPARVGNAELAPGLGNKIHGNTIGIAASGNAVVAGNSVYDNTEDGIQLDGADARRNVVFDNGGGGIVQGSACDSGDVLENRVFHNAESGIVLTSNSVARGNVVYGNDTGIVGSASTCPGPVSFVVSFVGAMENNLAYGNVIRALEFAGAAGASAVNNTVFQPSGTGIEIHADSNNVSLANNTVSIGDGHGILVDTDSETGFASDHNNWFVSGSGAVGRWQNTDQTSFLEWRTTTFTDSNSMALDPLFVDFDGADNVLGWASGLNQGDDDDFHLSSQYGSFHGGSFAPVLDPGTGLPVLPPEIETIDAVQSPLIDRGDTASSFANEPAPNGGLINLGAFGNTAQASKSPPEYLLVLQPDGGEIWPQDQTFTISWRSHNTANAVDIDLLQDGNPDPILNIADDTENDGEFSWTLPNSITPGNDYRIRVLRTDLSVADASDSPFTIALPVTTYYVNDDTLEADDWTQAVGSDSNDGFSPSTPKASIRGLLEAYDLGPGDVIKVDNGHYDLTVNILLEADDSGLTIEGFDSIDFPDRHALLDRGNSDSGSAVFELRGATNVTLDFLHMAQAFVGVLGTETFQSDGIVISNNTIRDMESAGIRIAASHQNPRVEDNRIASSNTGIDSSADNIVVQGNQVSHTETGILSRGMGSLLRQNTVFGGNQGITATNFGELATQIIDNTAHSQVTGISATGNALVRGNSTYGNSSAGILLFGNAIAEFNEAWDNFDGIVANDANGCGAAIRKNRVYHNLDRGIVIVGAGSAEDNVVYSNAVGIVGQSCIGTGFVGRISNNLAYDNQDHGIVVSTGRSGAAVINNSVHQRVGDAVRVQDSTSNASLHNNILVAESGFTVHVTEDSQPGFDSDYNNLHATGGGQIARWGDDEFATRADWTLALGFDQNSRSADPQFADPDGSDDVLGFSGIRIGDPTIVDNSDVEFSSTGPWELLPNGFDGDAVEIPTGAGESFATWTFSGLTSGATYLVSTTWIPSLDLGRAEFQIMDEERVDRVVQVDQFASPADFNDAGADWKNLSYTKITGDTLVVQLNNRGAANSRVRADAIRVQLVEGHLGADDRFDLLASSPSIDAGDPGDYYLREPAPNGERVNQGADGNWPDATTSSPRVRLIAPNGFETLEVGQTTTISWREFGLRSEQFVALVNNGGPTIDNWLFDAFDHSTGSFVVELSEVVDLSGTTEPAPVAVYSTLKSAATGVGSSLSYVLPVPDGDYIIRLHFVEPSEVVAGARVFDILAQDTLMLDNYDIAVHAGGSSRAVTQSFTTSVSGGAGLMLELINETDKPAILAAIEVITTIPGGVPSATVNLELSVDSGVTWEPLADSLAMDRFGQGSFDWTPAAATAGNTALVRVTANEGDTPSDRSDNPFQISPLPANQPPVLSGIANQQIDEGQKVTLTAQATDQNSSQTLTFSLEAGAPAGATIDGITGEFAWIPGEIQDGEYRIVVRVTDNGLPTMSDVKTFTVTVHEVNDPPVLANPGDDTSNELVTVNFTLLATDEDFVAGVADIVSYAIVSGTLPGMTLDGLTGAFRWTPDETHDGQHVVVFRAKDNHEAASVEQTVTITVADVNEAPVLASPGDRVSPEQAELSFTLAATDGDIVAGVADNVMYSIVAGSLPGMSLNAATGSFRWTPTETQDGQYVVVFQAKDSPNEAGADQSITITVSEVNDSPALANPGDQSSPEGVDLHFVLSALDSDVVAGIADTLVYSIVSGSLPGMTLDSASGDFHWTSAESQDGERIVVFRATDNHSTAGADQTVTITIEEVNDPPILTNPGNQILDINTPLDFTLTATDADTVAGVPDTVTYSIVDGGDTGMTLNGSTGEFQWAPTESQIGEHVVLFRAIDHHDAAGDDQTITITVALINDPPTAIALTGAALEENISGASVGTLTATDPDGAQTHTFTTSDSRFEIADDTLKLKAGVFVVGATVSVEVTAKDSGTPPFSLTQTLVLNVIPNPRSWQFKPQRFDTNGDGSVVPLDALRIINQLNDPTILGAGGKLPDSRPADSTLPLYDVNGDGFCTPNDVLQVVNFLNSLLGEGEGVSSLEQSVSMVLLLPSMPTAPARSLVHVLRLPTTADQRALALALPAGRNAGGRSAIPATEDAPSEIRENPEIILDEILNEIVAAVCQARLASFWESY